MKLVCTIILVCFFSYQTFAGTINICSTGCDYNSIAEAVEMANPFDTLLIHPGIYYEYEIVIQKPLIVIGENFPVVDSQNHGEIIRVESDSVVIKGLELKNVGTNYIKDFAAINIVKCNACRVLSNKLTNTFFGIYLQKSRNCEVSDNNILGQAELEMSSGNAIHLWYCKNITIINNKCIRHRDGIYLEFVDSSRIENNLSKDNLRYGLHFMFSNYDEYRHNTFENNGSGVAVMFSKFIQMSDNHFINNWGSSSYGLLLKEITDSKIIENEFRRNTTGIYAESATRILIQYNDFYYNGWAIKMLGSSMNNEFLNNNLVGNTMDLTTNAARNTNTYTGNYWSNYSGYDLDKDGFGDVPHKLIQLYSHILGKVPEAIILVRSPLVDLLNFVESTTPVFTPAGLADPEPSMHPIQNNFSYDPD